MSKLKSVLTIAGSDSSGGAGIQADIKTIQSMGLFAQSAITALTAQNTTGVYGVHDVPTDFVAQQIDVVFDDIRPDAVKIGMVSSAEIVASIVDALERNDARNIVVDPVMVATSGSELASNSAIAALRDKLIPLATVITPNMPEAEALFGSHIEARDEQERAALEIARAAGVAVLVKGGHGENDANDVLARPDGTVVWFEGERVDTANTHGTGCTLSSAIACGLALGKTLEDAVRGAKAYITGALSAGLDLGKGSGPLDHMWQHR
jgi:hydroxymethylpyrimidine/phosphomethylpyrimidine kinase